MYKIHQVMNISEILNANSTLNLKHLNDDVYEKLKYQITWLNWSWCQHDSDFGDNVGEFLLVTL